MEKVLIIKLGFVETIGKGSIFDGVSLGDVFRTTAILHLFKDSEVTWLVSKEASQLLYNNEYIKRTLIYDLTSILQLQSEYFDVVINLEKIPGICAFSDKIPAWKRYGFRFDASTGTAKAYDKADEILANSDDATLRKTSTKPWISMLYEMLGKKWQGEEYILGYKPKTNVEYDIGFNLKTGKKWRNKSWQEKHWQVLEKLLDTKYKISYQESLDDIFGYIDWLNQHRLIVTNDSLGLHLALALKKKVIALFGPTSSKEIEFFNRGLALEPENYKTCMPCYDAECKYELSCINEIEPEKVAKEIDKLLQNG